MKLSVSIFLVAICTVCLAAKQSEAKNFLERMAAKNITKKGCNAYGYACYGNHGKRSLQGDATGLDMNDLQERSDTVVQFYPSEANVLIDGNLEAIPRYKLIKMMRSWFGNPHRRPVGERGYEVDYPSFSAEFLNRESNTNNNNNSYK